MRVSLVSAITPPFKDASPDLPKILMNTNCSDLCFSKACGYLASLTDSVLGKLWVLHPETQGTAEQLPLQTLQGCSVLSFTQISPRISVVFFCPTFHHVIH